MGLFKKKPMRPSFMDPEHDYAEATFWGDVFERIKRRTFRGEKIYIELWGYTNVTLDGRIEQKCRRMDRWTEEKKSMLRLKGFTKVNNFAGYDSIAWWGVPIPPCWFQCAHPPVNSTVSSQRQGCCGSGLPCPAESGCFAGLDPASNRCKEADIGRKAGCAFQPGNTKVTPP